MLVDSDTVGLFTSRRKKKRTLNLVVWPHNAYTTGLLNHSPLTSFLFYFYCCHSCYFSNFITIWKAIWEIDDTKKISKIIFLEKKLCFRSLSLLTFY